MSIKIDDEFQSLIPPLTDDEFQRLEKSILAEGVREPIITWDGTIIDGHNRYKICTKHGLVCPNREREFESRDAAKIWIYNNQLGRRNLEAGQKAALVIERNEAKVREAARLRQTSSLKQNQEHNDVSDRWGQRNPTEPESEKGRTAEILAKQAGVGSATIKRVLKVKRENPELYDKVRSGEVSSLAAYKQVTDKSAKKRNYHDAERSLRENVPVYSIDSLIMELTYSAETLRESWQSSVETNESMGVKLTKTNKARLEKAVNNLFAALEKLERKSSDA